jgi:geranylgeranyl diphosphate synthase type 3
MPSSTSPTHPFASPNAIPPRTSSTGILNLNGHSAKQQQSVLRPLSEIDWLGQSKKSKTSHQSSAEPLNAHAPEQQQHEHEHEHAMDTSTNTGADADAHMKHAQSNFEPSTKYPTPLSPPTHHTKGIGEDLIYGNGVAWTEEKERLLLGPYDYLYGHPGKDIRSQCIAAFNLWLKVPPERLEVITRVVGMLHTASLLYTTPPQP